MKKHGHVSCEAWQGEAGYPSWFPDKHFLPHTKQSSEHQQGVWQLRRYFLDASENLGMSSYFQMADMWEKAYEKARETIQKPAAQGIVNGLTYTPKKSCETISRIATFFSGDVKPLDCYATGGYTGDQKDIYGRKVLPFIRNSKTPMFAYYVPYYVQDETCVRNGFWLDISKSPDFEQTEDYVVIDMYTGEVFEVAPIKETNHMLFFRNLPFADYPMVLCAKSAFTIEEI